MFTPAKPGDTPGSLDIGEGDEPKPIRISGLKCLICHVQEKADGTIAHKSTCAEYVKPKRGK